MIHYYLDDEYLISGCLSSINHIKKIEITEKKAIAVVDAFDSHRIVTIREPTLAALIDLFQSHKNTVDKISKFKF